MIIPFLIAVFLGIVGHVLYRRMLNRVQSYNGSIMMLAENCSIKDTFAEVFMFTPYDTQTPFSKHNWSIIKSLLTGTGYKVLDAPVPPEIVVHLLEACSTDRDRGAVIEAARLHSELLKKVRRLQLFWLFVFIVIAIGVVAFMLSA